MAPTENVRKSSNMTEGKKSYNLTISEKVVIWLQGESLQSDYKEKIIQYDDKEKGYNLTIKERVTIW